jgi:hypothetical protein
MAAYDAIRVYMLMRDMADALRWPWQRKHRQRLRRDANALFIRAFYEADDIACVPVEVWTQYEEPFTTIYREVIERARNVWQETNESDFEDPTDYARRRDDATRRFEMYEAFEAARRRARERWTRAWRDGGGFAIPSDE